jgi:predicted DNA-binding transcriptional regulator AlpA
MAPTTVTDQDGFTDRLVDWKIVAKAIGCSRSMLWKMIKQEGFPSPIRYGSLNRWRVSEVNAWIDALPKLDALDAPKPKRKRRSRA